MHIEAIGNYRHRSKVAGFDFDWTIVRPKGNRTRFPKNGDVNDWTWLRAGVVDTMRRWYDKGWCIVIFTNQKDGGWKIDRVRNAAKALGFPVLIVAAIAKEEYKPNPILWESMLTWKRTEKQGKRTVDLANSFFVGDAMGRAGDWADSDKKFADAIGIKAIGPESAFPLPEREHVDIELSDKQEVIIMVGYPGSGKSTTARRIADQNGTYEVVSGDELKTPARIIREMRRIIKENKSPIIDATNPTSEGRKNIMEVAAKEGVSCFRIIHVTTSMEDSMARNVEREKAVPSIIYYVYRKRFEKPSVDESPLNTKIEIVNV